MTSVYGLDGCKGGWCAVRLDLDGDEVVVHEPEVLPFGDVLATDAEVIAIDIPIGLVDGPNHRECDVEARRLLKFPRSRSVFTAPALGTIGLDLSWGNYPEVNSANRRCTEGRGLAKQSFAIAPKIKQVDDQMTPAVQDRVREVHPELCFWALAGHPMRHNKKRAEGHDERWTVLRSLLPALPAHPELPNDIARTCATDDYIDALVAAWTAACIVRARATRIPAEPSRDNQGLRMEMWFPTPADPMAR